MTQKELKEVITKIVGNNLGYKHEWFNNCIELLVMLVNKHTTEVIGEDEDINNVHDFFKTKKHESSAYDYAGGEMNGKNFLRKQQRKRAGL